MYEPRSGDLLRCRHCGRDIMWTRYNGRLRWCHIPLLRVRCSDTVATPPEGYET